MTGLAGSRRQNRGFQRLGELVLCVVSTSALLVAGACREEPDEAAEKDRRLPVFVSIPPQKYFVERVGGADVKVSVMVPPGQAAETYEPTPKQMVALSEADIYFTIGMPFERHLVKKIARMLKDVVFVDTCADLDLLTMTEPHDHHGDVADEHGAEDEHVAESGESHDHAAHGHGEVHDVHEEMDPHVWMNPRLVKIQAKTVCESLSKLLPDRSEAFEANLADFQADLDRVDQAIARQLEPLRGREFFVFHPAFGYFAEAYGLKQVAVETGGREPNARQLAALIGKARNANVKLILVQPQFSPKSAERVAEAIDGAVVPVDPLAEDYLVNLEHLAGRIEEALGGKAAGGGPPGSDTP